MPTMPAEDRTLDWLTPPSDDELVFFTEEPVESDYHRDLAALLIALLHRLLGPTSFVSGNQAVYFSETQARNRDFLAPDVFAIVGDTDNRRRLGWVTWREGGRLPDFIVEILSPSTEAVDRGKKKRLYEKVLRVAEYFIFDPESSKLEGYRLVAGHGYEAIVPDAAGRLRSDVLNTSLGVAVGTFNNRELPWIRLFDAQGELLPTDGERAEQEAQRAEQEAQRADALAARIAAYEAQFGPLPSAD